MQFWTYEEFQKAIKAIDNIKARTAITLLYYSGMRKGELLALTWEDLKGNKLTINKSYQRLHGQDLITPPKTSSSVRTILLPSQATEALHEWRRHSISETIFPFEKEFIEKAIKEVSLETGIKRIRVHDLRHSHASYLISRGANIVLVAKRLGHAKPAETLNTYSHLFPDDEVKLIDIMENE
jgi:integrase